MNIANSKSALVNNSLTSNIQDKICNCLGCSKLANIAISLNISEKTITILVCESCQHKFKES